MKCYLSRLIYDDRITTLLLSRIIKINIDSISEKLSQFYNLHYWDYVGHPDKRLLLSDMLQCNAITKVINMEWCLITTSDLKQLSIHALIGRDEVFIDTGEVYRININDSSASISFYDDSNTIRLTYEADEFEVSYPYQHNTTGQPLCHKYCSDEEGSYFLYQYYH